MFSKLFLFAVVFLTFGIFSNAQAATFTVTLGGDSNNGACGQFCTLRDAITAANANGAGADIINFNINPAVAIIQPTSPLPIIKTSLTIDGTTQTGYFGAPEIILDGAGAGGSASGLQIESPASAATLNVKIRGLAINRFSLHGIFSNCTNACNLTVQGSRIGTNSSGLIDFGNGVDGINIVESGGSSYTIGGAGTFEGNVISGNERMGISIQPLSSSVSTGTGTATIVGNLIGVNSAGTAALGNSGREIDVTNFAGGTNNIYQLTLIVGGTAAAHRNVISGNGADGIAYIAHDVSILGNYIGTNQAGAAALANDGDGIEAGKSFHAIIGGLTSASRNVISGNDDSGIALEGSAEIYNNYIGTTASGNGTIGNGGNGILIDSTTGATIGGSFSIAGATLDVGNVISGNGTSGIAIFSAAPTEPYLIKRNRIGTNAAGTSAIPNQQDGIFMGYPNTASNVPHVIGSDTNAADGNVISGNGGDGIEIGATYRLVKIFGNRIGTNLAATAVIHNQGNGLVIRSELNQIGQTGNDTAANVISGNAFNGITIVGAEAKYNKIYNNYIGTNPAGANLGNIKDGVYINTDTKHHGDRRTRRAGR